MISSSFSSSSSSSSSISKPSLLRSLYPVYLLCFTARSRAFCARSIHLAFILSRRNCFWLSSGWVKWGRAFCPDRLGVVFEGILRVREHGNRRLVREGNVLLRDSEEMGFWDLNCRRRRSKAWDRLSGEKLSGEELSGLKEYWRDIGVEGSEDILEMHCDCDIRMLRVASHHVCMILPTRQYWIGLLPFFKISVGRNREQQA